MMTSNLNSVLVFPSCEFTRAHCASHRSPLTLYFDLYHFFIVCRQFQIPLDLLVAAGAAPAKMPKPVENVPE